MLIKLKNVSKKYQINYFENKNILNNYNLEIDGYKMNFIVGESGIGKTTLLKIIGLQEKIDCGNYWIDDKKINYNSEKEILKYRNEEIGFIHQEALLIDKLSVIDNILVPSYIKGNVNDVIYNRAKSLLEQFEIESIKDCMAAKLSGGEKQRVEVARALINDPSIIIADEPTASLDKKNEAIIMNKLRSINRQQNKLIIIATHDYSIIDECDRVIELF